MNKHENLINKLRERKQVIATNIVLINSSPMLELINEDYLDCVIIDMEHGIFNNENEQLSNKIKTVFKEHLESLNLNTKK